MPAVDPIDNQYTRAGAVTNATVTAVGGTFSAAILDSNFAALTAKVNELIAALREADIITGA